MRYYFQTSKQINVTHQSHCALLFFSGSPIGVESDVCVCLSVCLPVCVRVRVCVKRTSPKTSIYQRRVSTLSLQSPCNQLWRVDSAKPKDSLEEAKEQSTLRRRGNVFSVIL